MDAHGSAYLNRIAREMVSRLDSCYKGESTAADEPEWVCPPDLRGLLQRRPKWRLPGAYFFDIAAIAKPFCGRSVGTPDLPDLRPPRFPATTSPPPNARADL